MPLFQMGTLGSDRRCHRSHIYIYIMGPPTPAHPPPGCWRGLTERRVCELQCCEEVRTKDQGGTGSRSPLCKPSLSTPTPTCPGPGLFSRTSSPASPRKPSVEGKLNRPLVPPGSREATVGKEGGKTRWRGGESRGREGGGRLPLDPTIHHPHGNLSPEPQEAASS